MTAPEYERLSYRGPTGVFSVAPELVGYLAPRDGQLTQSVSPDFLFIRMFIMIYLFVLDDSLTS